MGNLGVLVRNSLLQSEGLIFQIFYDLAKNACAQAG